MDQETEAFSAMVLKGITTSRLIKSPENKSQNERTTLLQWQII